MGEANNAPANQKPDMKTSLILGEASIIQAAGADFVIIMGITNDTLKYLWTIMFPYLVM